jgi:hypothetical protein
MDELEELQNDLEWIGKKKIAGREANGFRVTYFAKELNRDTTRDYWIDAETKRPLVIQTPGADRFDLEAGPLRTVPPEKKPWEFSAVEHCEVLHDIVLDAELDDSLFSLGPPAGYGVAQEAPPEYPPAATEAEMIEYLGLLAQCRDNKFPDRLSPTVLPRINIYAKPEQDRTAAEKKLFEWNNEIKGRIHRTPVASFHEDRVVRDSWRYLGKGAKFGDKDRIVCWYRPKGSKSYRVVYADLSVKDVADKDLPLAAGRPR